MKGHQRKTTKPQMDLMEKFHASPWPALGKIIPTSTKPKDDIFESFKPNKRCVDYKISETWAKMQRGDLKVNIKQTCATYEDIPPEICKPEQIKKKVKYFHGGPPQWKFIDETWKEHVKIGQADFAKEYKIINRKGKVQRASKQRNDHAMVQRLVGPEWFMELSPKQFEAIDQLKQAVLCDIRNNATVCCEESLANLGLVLRPSLSHIRVALKHSCGCPIEFLLVLYQLTNPNRKNYSLNDRLLLSAVVHLNITPTLRELHVRIPSPPKEPEEPKQPKKKEKRKTYPSPYLEPQTYQPAPPRFSGIYKKKHIQYPENPYFSYIQKLEIEKKNKFEVKIPRPSDDEEAYSTIKEYTAAQEYYQTLPGVKQKMLQLIPPTSYDLCWNMLNSKKEAPQIDPRFIVPHLCKITASELMVCCCKKKEPLQKKTCSCEKRAQKFMASLCFCEECIRKIEQDNLIRIHGGLRRTAYGCEEPIPIIQGTVQGKKCDCYTEYKNKTMTCAARQRLIGGPTKYVVGGLVLSKFGPVYSITGIIAEKECFCHEIVQRKTRLKQIKSTLLNNEAKFVIGGVTMTENGPVYNLTSVVARKPCKCILKYRQQLEILTLQNKLRSQPTCFVNNGLVRSKFGPIFCLSGVPDESLTKRNSELKTVCSCEIKKTKCFNNCLDYLDYKTNSHKTSSDSSDSEEDSEEVDSQESSLTESESDSEEICDNNNERSSSKGAPTRCSPHSMKKRQSETSTNSSISIKGACPHVCQSKKYSPSIQSNNSTLKNTTCFHSRGDEKRSSPVESVDDSLKPKPCTCKQELERFMKAKCPCEECNRKIRQGYARFIVSGLKQTASGNQVNMVQGIHQPLCSCMQDHLKNMKRIDDYKSRLKARYDLRKQPKKYLISGVTATTNGPVYIISGIRPPVQCECAKAALEKQQAEAFEKQRAKPPNTGRIKYEISGVRAMPEENIYMISRALKIPPCACEKLLERFEDAHKDCLQEFQKYLSRTDDETSEFDMDYRTSKKMGSVDLDFTQGLENIENAHLPLEDEIKTEDDVIEKSGDISQSNLNNVPAQCEDAERVSTSNSEPQQESTSSDEDSSSSEELSDSDSSKCGHCLNDYPIYVTPITISNDKPVPDSFLSKRFAIFRNKPKCKKSFMKILKHILEGMAEDGYPLAKLPQVYKLPIFKLWFQLRAGAFWTYEDKVSFHGYSKYMWRHTDVCYKAPTKNVMPFTIEKAHTMTWKHAKLIKGIAEKETNDYYRKLKKVTIDTGREFFATTYPYEFPTYTWRDCAFAYLPTKEENIFPYKIVQPHEVRVIPANKSTNCYC